jgi:hypothetical protein
MRHFDGDFCLSDRLSAYVWPLDLSRIITVDISPPDSSTSIAEIGGSEEYDGRGGEVLRTNGRKGRSYPRLIKTGRAILTAAVGLISSRFAVTKAKGTERQGFGQNEIQRSTGRLYGPARGTLRG